MRKTFPRLSSLPGFPPLTPSPDLHLPAHAWRLVIWEASLPLSEDQSDHLRSMVPGIFGVAGPVFFSLSEDADRLLLLLAHTTFPAPVHRDLVTWLCLHQLAEDCLVFLEREGRVLVSPPLQFAHWPDDPMQQLSEMSDWWDFVSPISSSDAHHYRDVITTQLRRGRYNHLSGPFLRLLRGIPDPGPFCAAFVPVMIEAIWALHAELSLRTLLESLSLTVLTRKPPEAVTAWLTSLSDVLDACPRDHAPDLELVLQTIRQNPSLPYTQARLAHSLGISPAYFCRLFHEKTGQPFSSFLIEARIQLARTLLADRTLSMQEVAEKCGYTNRIYFSRLFRAYTGISPADYAQQLLSVSDASDLRS